MSEYLLLMSIGPVQEFIAQARRTRDLWFGSHVLSEVSRAAARALAEKGAELIFPALEKNSEHLLPSDAIRNKKGERSYNVANRILASVHGDPRAAATAARRTAIERLLALGKKALARDDVRALLGPEGEPIEKTTERAFAQLASLLEIHVIWTELDAASASAARERLEEEMAARKTFHTFEPWREQRGGLHKSSLDGGRETVLRQEGRDSKPWLEYQIGVREQLDAVGLLKRTGGTSGQFIPLPNIGLAPWLERADQRAHPAMKALGTRCEQYGFVPVRGHADRDWIRACSFDAQLFLPDRWQPYFADHGLDVDDAGTFGHTLVKPVLHAMREEPYPYVACLIADGDHMGKAIDTLAGNGLDALQGFSRELAAFASSAQRIVEGEHRGVLVYAGGDDVLAFVCVQDALSCARRLREEFEKIVSSALNAAGVTGLAPTLSVGIGVGHVLQSMGRLLELGRQAEKLAKKTPRPDGSTRDALALIFERHSGALRSWHESWRRKSWPHDPCELLARDVAHLQGDTLSMGKIHEVEDALRRAPAHDSDWFDVLRGEVTRILARTEAGHGQKRVTPEQVGLTLELEDYQTLRTHIARWVDRMLIAGELMRAQASIADTKEAS